MNHSSENSIPCIEPSCKKPIRFITMKKSGKPMPVDADMIIAKEEEIKGIFILPNGAMVRSLLKGQVGYRPHWATCTKAMKFRKKEERKIAVVKVSPGLRSPEEAETELKYYQKYISDAFIVFNYVNNGKNGNLGSRRKIYHVARPANRKGDEKLPPQWKIEVNEDNILARI